MQALMRGRHARHVMETVGSPTAAACSELAASWNRSAIRYGLSPDLDRPGRRVDAADLARRRERHARLLDVAQPTLDILWRAVLRSGCCVVLAEADGVILYRRAAAGDERGLDLAGLVNGAAWAEADEGTNGIGTCLAEDRPITIHRDQHFATRNIAFSCAGAPIHGEDGRLVAALDISTLRTDHDEARALLIASLVTRAAQDIERNHFCRHFADHRIVLDSERPGWEPILLAVDRDDLVVGANRLARLFYKLDDDSLARPRPASDILTRLEGLGTLEDGERSALRQALARSGGNVTAAARRLGIGRATLYRRLKIHQSV